ncbi:hypothetical protein JF66_00710 [Cryobacterium sp. MLB-32]|nr:hypothetical protein JF66_00710 [Cryobacterium sp. MLB-32]
MLDRKQHILADELERLHLHADTTGREWTESAEEAALWLGRTAALDGPLRIEQASPAQLTGVDIELGGSMGLTYPVDARCRPAPSPLHGGSAALSYALTAHTEALSYAVRHAAVQRAVQIVTAELAGTRARARSIENRWIPRLEAELADIRRRIEDQEREETLRVRWASEPAEEAR